VFTSFYISLICIFRNSITRDPFYDMLQARKKKATHKQVQVY